MELRSRAAGKLKPALLRVVRQCEARLDSIRHPVRIGSTQVVLDPIGFSAGGEHGWRRSPANPLLGGVDGVIFDVAVLVEGDVFRMWSSWRSTSSIAASVSIDGVHWSRPRIVLPPGPPGGWMTRTNRPSVVRTHDGRWHMWFTGQTPDCSSIGYATSDDGWNWELVSPAPVMVAEHDWEKVAVMAPTVLADERGGFLMWYSAGDQYEPDAIGFAASPDGIHWTKHPTNPVFVPDVRHRWEQAKVTAPSVVWRDGWFYLFYIGFEKIDTARIGVARSATGIDGWERMAGNPILSPVRRAWDGAATYRPAVVRFGGRWFLWYNGRTGHREQIGLATFDGDELAGEADWRR